MSVSSIQVKSAIRFIFVLIPIATFSFLFWKDWNVIGTTEDEAYIYSRENKVLDISAEEKKKENGETEIIYKPVFAPCEKKIGDIRIVSRNFPPIYSVELFGVRVPVLVWPHITYLTYFPQNLVIFSAKKLGVKELIIAEKFLNYILVCITIFVVFVVGRNLFGDKTGFFSSLFFATLSSTKFFSLIGISIDFIFHTLYFWLSALFILKLRKSENDLVKNITISSVFCALSILSYLKFSSWAFLSFAVFLSLKGGIIQKARGFFLFMLIPTSAFLIFYILPSISLPLIGCSEKYKIDVLSSTVNLIMGASKFYSSLLVENLELIYVDIFRMLDITGYGYRLAYHDKLEFSLIPSIPFILSLFSSFFLLFHSSAENKENSNMDNPIISPRFFAFLFFLYDILLYLELPYSGFHRKLRPLMPALCMITGKLAADLLTYSIRRRKLKTKFIFILAFLSMLFLQVYIQVLIGERFSEKLRKDGRWSIQTNYKVQKELLEFIMQNKEKGKKIANFSATCNLDLIADKEGIIDYDFSYIVHFSKSYLLTDILFWETSLIAICQLSERKRETIYILADELSREFLEKRAEKVGVISEGKTPIFYIFTCRVNKNKKFFR